MDSVSPDGVPGGGPPDRPSLLRAFARASVRVRPPNPTGVGSFLAEEGLANAVGWTAGLVSSWLVGQFFVRRGIGNLWGLAAGGRTAVSRDEYELLATVTSYVVGLVVLVLARHLVIGTWREYAAMRRSG